MAKGIYAGVNGIARKVKRLYIGVNGKARTVVKVYVGVGGVARLAYVAPIEIWSDIENRSLTWAQMEADYPAWADLN